MNTKKGMFNCFSGWRVYESVLATVESQIKTHRKKRVNKKWLKKYGTKQVPGIIKVGTKLIAHPDVMRRFSKLNNLQQQGGRKCKVNYTAS